VRLRRLSDPDPVPSTFRPRITVADDFASISTRSRPLLPEYAPPQPQQAKQQQAIWTNWTNTCTWRYSAKMGCSAQPTQDQHRIPNGNPDHKLSGYDLALGPGRGDAQYHRTGAAAAPKAKWPGDRWNDTFVLLGVAPKLCRSNNALLFCSVLGVPAQRGCAGHDATLRKYVRI
jgi:hypothetical protein